MAMMIADSDILIDFLRGREPGHARIDIELRTDHLATTLVNAFELLSGARNSKEQAKVEVLLKALTILPVDARAADLAATVRRELEGRGQGIGMADYLIAGVCLVYKGTLLTRNTGHFARVRGLHLGAIHVEDER